MDFEFIPSIQTIARVDWEAICGRDYPFLRYNFLASLESTGCANKKAGWEPHHLIIRENNKVIGVMPLYIKHHSYGEYVFDWAWADAYHRNGLDYYPKLLTAIPYTPATGPRLCFDTSANIAAIMAELTRALQNECEALGASSWHCLFPTEEVAKQLTRCGISARHGCQFHWLNNGFRDFDDFLSTFNSRKRKNLNKERRKVAEQGIEIRIKEGTEITGEEWEQFYLYYHLTYFKRSGRQGYLNKNFFLRIGESLPEHIMMVQALRDDVMVAAALCFKSGDTLYGRYWGCEQEYDMLHFECCYYQGIEYAIANKLQRFDPGAQGEHKIQRGFTPIPTYSNHWIVRADFRNAINDFLAREQSANQDYISDAATYLPFKQTETE